MSELKTISIDGVDHDFESMTDEQKNTVAHITDLSQKLSQLQFQATQLSVAKAAFVDMLKASLTQTKEQQ